MQSENIIEIDGSVYEGGGQILRNSIALSNILRKPFLITNIRKSRPKPGLNNQLMSAIALMKEISDAIVDGDKLLSTSLSFYPKNILGGTYKAKCHTAASITLMTQSLIPTLIFGGKNSQILLEGGTLVSKSPPSSSVTDILSVLLRRIGVIFEYQIQKEGLYPKGGGLVKLTVQPIKKCLTSIEMMQKSRIIRVNVEICHYEEKVPVKDVVKELKKRVKKLVATQKFIDDKKSKENEETKGKSDSGSDSEPEETSCEINIDVRQLSSGKKPNKLSTYCVVFQAFGQDNRCFFDCSRFPENRISIEDCLEEVLSKFETYLNEDSCLDEFHQDQLLIFMALAEGVSRIKIGNSITEHTKAALYIIEKFIPEAKIKILEPKAFNEGFIIQIEGVAHKSI